VFTISTTDSTIHPIILTWMDEAVCKNKTSLFFPKLAERPEARKRREAEAKLICAQCPVKIQCRDYARSNHEFGVWGGESEIDREKLGYSLPPKYISKTRKTHQLQQKYDII
jgi:WhiB family redox-sensing transcriptional regulator